MRPEDVIKRPLILTEKGNRLREEQNQYFFEVDRRANKIDIKKAVQTLFDVSVSDVRTLIMRGRTRRLGRIQAKGPNWKKAVVTLKSGEHIDLFEGG